MKKSVSGLKMGNPQRNQSERPPASGDVKTS
jgi:hypothetical protein